PDWDHPGDSRLCPDPNSNGALQPHQRSDSMSSDLQYDVLVIGSGAAGLTLALNLARSCRVAVLSKGKLQEGSTWFAQGGIAAVLDIADSVEAHVRDTMEAGRGLCHEDAVRFTVENSKAAIDWLVQQGVEFTRDEHNSSEFH